MLHFLFIIIMIIGNDNNGSHEFWGRAHPGGRGGTFRGVRKKEGTLQEREFLQETPGTYKIHLSALQQTQRAPPARRQAFPSFGCFLHLLTLERKEKKSK